MKCKCGSYVTINSNTIEKMSYTFVITCENCKRVYLESDFSEKEIEKTYYNKTVEKSD